MLVACLGDIMLDVIVDAPAGLAPDDDTSAAITFTPGGQAANVAGWVHALGGDARLFGPRATQGPGRFVGEALEAAGIEVHGPVTDRAGTVVSVVSAGVRSLASDPGTTDWLEHVSPGRWLDDADWLFVSGYAIFRAPRPDLVVDVASAARARGAKVAVDMSSAAMITAFGARRFRHTWEALRPAVVLANEQEWAATNAPDRAGSVPGHPRDGWRASGFGAGGTSVLVLKRGAAGCSFVIDGVSDHRSAAPGPVVDTTGAGDALTAGFLLGGPDLAMEAAARCVGQVGAQPRATLSGMP
jgi:ribokinase